MEEGKHSIRYQWVDYDQISPYLIRAVVAAEDADFHASSRTALGCHQNGSRKKPPLRQTRSRGFDAHSADRQEPLFVSRQKLLQKSTGNHSDTDRRSYLGAKTRILEIYLNIAEFGNGIFGAQAAARYYFNKNAANLSRAEAIRFGLDLD